MDYDWRHSPRLSLWLWIKHTWLKVKEGEQIPWYGLLLRGFFFPGQFIAWAVCKPYRNLYNPATDVYTLHGQKYTGALFSVWAKDGLPVGTCFKIIKRDRDGSVMIRRCNVCASIEDM